jgi:hypothetical protein
MSKVPTLTERIGGSVMLPRTHAERRKPFVDVITLPVARILSKNHAKKTNTSGRESKSSKRTLAETSSDDSDDELSLPYPQKKRHLVHQPRIWERSSDSEDELDNSIEETSLMSHSSCRSHNTTTTRRNPRGKLLRAMSGMQYKRTAFMKQYEHVGSESEDEGTDDELSFGCVRPVQKVARSHCS